MDIAKNQNLNYIDVIGFKVFSDHISKIPIYSGNCKVINTISPNSYGIATKDTEFESALKKTDFLVLDGVYFALASILLHGKNIKKNQGPDVFYHFMERLNKNSQKVFFLGSSENTLEKIRTKTKLNYPKIKLDCFSPPFKSEFSDQDNLEMIRLINTFRPDILFVGMTCPKQEKWAMKNRHLLQVGLTICIGNVFDWYAGTQKVIHPIWFKLRLGWFIRIFLRPEVFRRNIGNQMRFFYHLLLLLIKIKKI